MRFRTILLGASCLIAGAAMAQSETDVLRYSQTFMKGSARFTAMGGAFGALGGDVSSFMINPAGAGIYRSSEFSFSTGIFNSNQKVDYEGYKAFDGHTSLNVGNAGLVLNLFCNNKNDVRAFNIGIAYNRVNDFNSNFSLVGSEGSVSMLDAFKNSMNGRLEIGDWQGNQFAPGTLNGYYRDLAKSDWKHKLAWMNGLVDVDEKDKDNIHTNQYFVPLDPDDKVTPYQYAEVRGFKDVVNLAFGANVFDIAYFGAGLNISNVNYHSVYTYTERAAVGNISNFRYFNFDQVYNAYGTGVSLSLGAILKPIQELRIGISYESPTWLHLDEDYSGYMNSNYNKNGDASEIDYPSYRISTPQKLTGSVAAVLGTAFTFSADLEWANYDGMKLKSKSSNGTLGAIDAREFDSRVNKYIESDFRNTINVRVGGEMNVDRWTLRAGYQHYKNPYVDGIITDHPTLYYSLPGSAPTGGWRQQGSGVNKATNVYSAGFGYRTKTFFFDFAYGFMNMKNSYSMYDLNYFDKDGKEQNVYSGTATANINRNSYIVTLGFKF